MITMLLLQQTTLVASSLYYYLLFTLLLYQKFYSLSSIWSCIFSSLRLSEIVFSPCLVQPRHIWQEQCTLFLLNWCKLSYQSWFKRYTFLLIFLFRIAFFQSLWRFSARLRIRINSIWYNAPRGSADLHSFYRTNPLPTDAQDRLSSLGIWR